MDTKKKLFVNMLIAQLGFLLLIAISYFSATNSIKHIMEKDIESIAKSIKETTLLYAKEHPKGYMDEDFKKAILATRVGETGYVYFIDSTGTLTIHPNGEGKNIAHLDFIKKLISNKDGGILNYYYAPTDQDKIVAYEYIPQWDMFLAPGVNKADYLDEINHEFLIYIVGVGIFLMITLAVLSIAISRSIQNGVRKYNDYLKVFLDFVSLKTNRMDKVVPQNNTEFSEMIDYINEMSDEFDAKIKADMKVIGEITLTLDKVEQGIFKCRVKSKTQNPMVMTLRSTINHMLDTLEANMQELEKVTNAYSTDDFREKINISPRLKENLLRVMQGVNTLGDALSSSARTNLDNGQSLQNNASYMKDSMNNLAAKANEQAASLEETSASLEEITSLTRNNAENSAKMAELGTTVKSAVSTGQDLASKTATSMEEINEKVTSINEAITVIDQIAFQTNILSLNAAVEAATAGEAGKGFAVVAQEVRNLAARSAEAAKEIKELVEDANEKANEGKSISSEMITGYENLNAQISETIHIIEDVSSASKEQMSGIEQINDAVTMLDRVTQENASEANQITSISDEVSSMAHELVVDAQNKKFN